MVTQIGDIPADMADQAAEYREKLVELAVEQDDAAMEMYLEVRLLAEQMSLFVTWIPRVGGARDLLVGGGG